jgi:anti-sigma regulatory factor (Ser/Thr protein kinase)
MSADEVTLQLPRERSFFGVAQLVVGGLAARHDLSFEQLEDLQVALGELLEQHESESDITVSLRLEGNTIHAVVGPFDESLERELDRESSDGVGLRRVLETVVDGVAVTSRDGQPWVELTKEVRR